MSKKRITLTLALIAGIAGAAHGAQGWTLLKTQGVRHFVAVEAAQSADPTALKEAASALCVAEKPCVVLFWSDARAAGTKMPLTPAQSKALVAQYSRNPASGSEQLMLKCRGDEAPGARCLK